VVNDVSPFALEHGLRWPDAFCTSSPTPVKFPSLFLFGLSLMCTRAQSQPLTSAQAERIKQQIRATLFVPEPLPALQPHTHRLWSPAPGVRAEGVTYATQFGQQVPAILYLPDPLPSGGAIPGLVIVCGHGGDKYSWYSYFSGIAYARAGAAVLTYDQPGEGERNTQRKSATREHDQLQGDAVLARRLGGLMVTDILQGVSYLSSRAEVDPKRIGIAGYSMGSFHSAIAGAIDPRIRVCVLTGGGNLDGPNGRWDQSKQMCQGLPYKSLQFVGDRPAVLYALNALRGPTLIWNGRADSVVSITTMQEPFFDDLRERTERLLGSKKNLFENGFDPTGGHRPYFVTKPVALWLEKQLMFPLWSEASIEKMPETHLSEWLAKTHVAIEATYATEIFEGGVRAVGDQYPGYQHEDLNVFTPTEWEANKSKLAFSTWAAAAKAANQK
jgi:dienelactone hydrolase